MPPPPPAKRIKRPPKVLDEDTYTSALSHIIARDFFPGLLESESTQDYLNALDAGDDEWIDEAEERVREVLSTPRAAARRGVSMTPRPFAGMGGETPRGCTWSGGTPVSVRGGNGNSTPRTPARQGPKTQSGEPVDMNLSLTDFQAKYTSEDNESFNKVLGSQNEKKREKYAWLWNRNKIPSARQIAQAAVEQKRLTQRPDHDRDRDPASRVSNAVTPNDSKSLILRSSQDPNTRPASITQIRPYEPRNTFMFAPSGDLSETHPHLTSTAQTAQDTSRADPKAVSYASTRLPQADFAHGKNDDDDGGDDAATEADTTISAIDAAIAGHPRHRSISTTAPSIAHADNEDGSATPHVNGYKFVDAEPTAAEVALHQSSEHPSHINLNAQTTSKQKGGKVRDRSDLLRHLIATTRGQESSEVDAAPNLFNLQEMSKREDLHHRMVEKQLAGKRKPAEIAPGIAGIGATYGDRLGEVRGDLSAKTATPRFPSAAGLGGRTPAGATPNTRREKLEKGGLTPAAQSLYSRIGRTPRGGGAFDNEADKGMSREWTPRRGLSGEKTKGSV